LRIDADPARWQGSPRRAGSSEGKDDGTVLIPKGGDLGIRLGFDLRGT